MRTATAWLLVAGLGLAAGVDARADTLDPADCAAPSGPQQRDLCQSAEYERLDAALGQALAAAQAALDDGTTCGSGCAAAWDALMAGQLAWLQFREQDCEAAYAIAVDGTGRNPARLDCLIEHTRIRTGQLQRLHRH